jgi:hypothetical protein
MTKEIEQIQEHVDANHCALEEELLSLLTAMRTRLLQKHGLDYQPVIDQLERSLAEQVSHYESEQRRSADLATKLAVTDTILIRLVNHIILYKNKDRTANTRSLIFKAWADLATGRAILARTATDLFVRDRQRHILFSQWVRRMRRVRLQRQKRDLRRSCEHDLRQKDNEAAERIAALQAELDAVKQLLIDHEKQHGDMQEKLRRAFMRGVVNLNLEAMDVFGEVPTTEALPQTRVERGRSRPADDGKDFVVEPAPRISVIRHH